MNVVSCEPFIFNEKNQILPICAARFSLLLVSQIWATLHKKNASLLIYLSLQPRLLSSVRALDFHGRSGLGRAKDLVFLGALPSLWWEAVPGLG
jgi:hypothetical protein